MKKTINILIVDDHSLVREGLRRNLSTYEEINIIGEAVDGLEAIDFVKKNPEVDVVLMDVTMPRMNGLQAVEQIQKLHSPPACLILSMHDKEEYILDSLTKGAMGYLLKESDAEEIIEAIQTVVKGKRYYSTPVSSVIAENYIKRTEAKMEKVSSSKKRSKEEKILSNRELEIILMLNEGLNNKDISEELTLSIRTVEVHRFNMMKKLKANSIVELLKITREKGLIN